MCRGRLTTQSFASFQNELTQFMAPERGNGKSQQQMINALGMLQTNLLHFEAA